MSTTTFINLAQIPVVVLNWNGFRDTKEAVESLLELDGNLLGKIVVIDNASSEQDLTQLISFCEEIEKVELVLNESNLGFGVAHNRVFYKLHAEGYKWVACLNNDAVADENWLLKLVSRAEGSGAHIVGSLMLNYHDRSRVDSAGHIQLNTGEVIPHGYAKPLSEVGFNTKLTSTCAGACLFSLKMFDRIGGFDPHFFLGYEDVELGLRAWLVGYNVELEPEAVAYHKGSVSIGKIRDEKYLASIQSHIFYSWFKLMPLSILLTHLPTMLFKYIAVLIVDIVMLRFKYFRVMLSGMIMFAKQVPSVITNRRRFKKGHRMVRSYLEINGTLTFFLPFDLERFSNLIFHGKKSNLEA